MNCSVFLVQRTSVIQAVLRRQISAFRIFLFIPDFRKKCSCQIPQVFVTTFTKKLQLKKADCLLFPMHRKKGSRNAQFIPEHETVAWGIDLSCSDCFYTKYNKTKSRGPDRCMYSAQVNVSGERLSSIQESEALSCSQRRTTCVLKSKNPVEITLRNHDIFAKHNRGMHSLVAEHPADDLSICQTPSVVADAAESAVWSPDLDATLQLTVTARQTHVHTRRRTWKHSLHFTRKMYMFCSILVQTRLAVSAKVRFILAATFFSA